MKSLAIIAIAVASSFLLMGCSIGMAPSGGSNEQVKAEFDKLPLEDRAKSIMSSPATQEFKMQKIKEMYAKEGKEPPADLFNDMGKGGAH